MAAAIRDGACARRVLLSILLLGAVLLRGEPVAAQPEAARFRSLQIEDGLSQSSVYSCFQDSRGFLWFTTEDGLNRYDGYDFLVYRNDPSDPHSLSYNYVSVVYEDRSGTLWVGTFGQGLNRFDYDTCWFTRFLADPEDSTSISNNTVLSIHEDDGGTLWFGTQEGLNRYDPLTESFQRVVDIGGGGVEPGAAAVQAMASTPERPLPLRTRHRPAPALPPPARRSVQLAVRRSNLLDLRRRGLPVGGYGRGIGLSCAWRRRVPELST
jgi:ligand-binding sensor domain-containing protein